TAEHQVREVIAHGGLKTYVQGKLIEPGSEKKRICVLAVRCQQLRSDGDDLSVHVSSLNEWQALHAPGEMKNGSGSDQDCPAAAGECQSNQAVAGDYQAGTFFWRDLNNAALAAQRGRNVKVSLGVESQPLRS